MTTELSEATFAQDADSTRIIAELGSLSTKPRTVDPGRTYAVPDGSGSIRMERIPEEAPKLDASRVVTDAQSFIDYIERHSNENSEVYADLARSSVVAVIDSHPSVRDRTEGPGRQKHRLTLALELTPSWQAWAMHNKDLGDQETFAEHLEENFVDVQKPDASELLEIAQTFQATRGVDFGQSTRLSNGETQIRYSEELQGKAGRKGELTIPEEFTLGLIPYVGGSQAYKVTAKLRWRLRDAHLAIGYTLIRPERVLEEAFNDILDTIVSEIDPPVFHGRP